VWTVTGKDIAEPRPIETAQSYDNLTIVTSGLSGGERVVTDGQYRLQRNAPVTFTSPQIAGSAGNL
jgi:multidrug efflux system membrane fusion protein